METSLIQYKTVAVNSLSIFYREGGMPDHPVLLFLHGFPSSSHMYRQVLSRLAVHYHVIAPDYPGFGLSSCPSPDQFTYTFDNLAAVMEQFVDALGLTQYSLYMQDYGSPVGFRMATRRPAQIEALIVQNANAYDDGLGPDVQAIGQLEQAGDEAALDQAIEYMVSEEGIREQYLYGAAHPNSISPDAYLSDHFFMELPGRKQIQKTLFKNYNTNFPLYEFWQNYLRTYQPPALIIWGKNDKIFTEPGAHAYLRDLPNAQMHLLDGGHFVLEEYPEAIAARIDDFLTQTALVR